MSITLTKNAILNLIAHEQGIDEDVLVQVINLKAASNGSYYSCLISDGYRKIKTALTTKN
jgi:hypothetical protein